MDTHGFNDHIITKDIYEDIAKDVKKKVWKTAPKRKKHLIMLPKVITLIKDD